MYVFPQLTSTFKAELKGPAAFFSFYASHMQTQMFWCNGHSLPFSTPCVASHKLPTFCDPVPNGPGRKHLWCTRVVRLFESDVLQPTCQNCWFTITFAEENQFWNGCHTSTNGLLFQQGALLHSYLSSRHPWGLHKACLRSRVFCLSAICGTCINGESAALIWLEVLKEIPLAYHRKKI